MDRFLGYFLPQAGSMVHVKRYIEPLSEQQYAEFEEAIRVTSMLRPYVIDFMGLEENFLTFNELAGEMKSQFEALTNPMIEGAIGGVKRIAKSQNALSNFLCSASAFRDRSTMRIKSRYGSDSPRVAAWTAVIAAAYDAHFEFRLLHNLRNYAQHHDIPLSLVPVRSKANDKAEIEVAVSVVLAPSKLLSSPLIQKNFRPQLSLISGDLDLNAAAEVYFRLHAGFLKATLEAYKAEIAWMHVYRNALAKHLKLPAGAFPAIWEGDLPLRDGETINQRIIHFSFDELDMILALYARVTELVPP